MTGSSSHHACVCLLFLLLALMMSPCRVASFSLGAFSGQRLGQRHYRTLLFPLYSSTVTPASETTTTTTSLPDEEATTAAAEFTTRPMTVYIEDTDAYGIMYNGNYLKSYDRALHMTSYASSSSADNIVLQHDGEWSIVSLDEMRFKVPPALGASFVISGKLVEQPSEYEQVWDLEMKSAPSEDGDDGIVYNTARGVRIAHAPPPPAVNEASNGAESAQATTSQQQQEEWIPQPPPLVMKARGGKDSFVTTQIMDSFQVFRDEFDSHLPGHLPLRNLLNLFERNRSDVLGGPGGGLGQLRQRDGVICVVTSLEQCSLVSYDDVSSLLMAGNSLTTQMDSLIKRGGAVIEFHQTALLSDKRVGQAIIKICMVDEATGRPIRRCPAWMEERLRKFEATADADAAEQE